MNVFHKWRPIEDLPQDWKAISDGELDSLLLVWQDQRERLDQLGVLQEATARIHREWAIETGIIEGAYTLDRGVTETLIQHGLSADLISRGATNLSPERLSAILHDHLDALELVFSFVKGERALSASFMHELHAALFQHVDTYEAYDSKGNLVEARLEKGTYKKLPNTVRRADGRVHEYAPPEQVASEMDRLVSLAGEIRGRNVPPEVEAAWLHHRFTQIHPYQDGNGRVARALASAVFVKAGWFPLSIHRDCRDRYIEALELADREDLRGLTAVFVEAQRRTMSRMIEASLNSYVPAGLEDALNVLAAKHRAAASFLKTQYERVHLIERDVFGTAKEIVWAAADKINKRFDPTHPARPAAWTKNEAGLEKWKETLDGLLHPDHAPKALGLMLGSSKMLGLVFGVPKPQFIGIIDIWPIFQESAGEFIPLRHQPFSINYRDNPESVLSRLQKWLDAVLGEALIRWGGP